MNTRGSCNVFLLEHGDNVLFPPKAGAIPKNDENLDRDGQLFNY